MGDRGGSPLHWGTDGERYSPLRSMGLPDLGFRNHYDAFVHDHAVIRVYAGFSDHQVKMPISLELTAKSDISPKADVEGSVCGLILDLATSFAFCICVESDPELAVKVYAFIPEALHVFIQ